MHANVKHINSLAESKKSITADQPNACAEDAISLQFAIIAAEVVISAQIAFTMNA